MEKAEEILDELTTKVSELVENSLKTLQEHENTIKEIGEDAIKEIKEEIDKIFATIKKSLDQEIKVATKSKIKANELTKYVTEFNELTTKTIENSIKSLTEETTTGVKVITEAILEIKKIMDQVCDLSERLKNCSTSWYSITGKVRLALIVKEMVKMQTTIPLKITEQGANVASFVTDFPVHMKKVGTDIARNAQEEATRIVDDLKTTVGKMLLEMKNNK